VWMFCRRVRKLRNTPHKLKTMWSDYTCGPSASAVAPPPRSAYRFTYIASHLHTHTLSCPCLPNAHRHRDQRVREAVVAAPSKFFSTMTDQVSGQSLASLK
jgi:hypothetical protein